MKTTAAHEPRAAVAKPEPSSRSVQSVVGAAAASLRMQRFTGNRATTALLQSVRLQSKLTISEPDDPYEHEADRVADQVMRMPAPGGSALHLLALEGGAGALAPPIVHDVLRSPGHALDGTTRAYMEP